MVSVVIGWDIGGVHLKAARVKHGRVEAVVQAATPLWLGLDSLHAAFDVHLPSWEQALDETLRTLRLL